MFSSIAGAAVVAAAALWWASRRRRRLALAAEPLLPHLGARVVGASAAALAALPAGDPAWAEYAQAQYSNYVASYYGYGQPAPEPAPPAPPRPKPRARRAAAQRRGGAAQS